MCRKQKRPSHDLQMTIGCESPNGCIWQRPHPNGHQTALGASASTLSMALDWYLVRLSATRVAEMRAQPWVKGVILLQECAVQVGFQLVNVQDLRAHRTRDASWEVFLELSRHSCDHAFLACADRVRTVRCRKALGKFLERLGLVAHHTCALSCDFFASCDATSTT